MESVWENSMQRPRFEALKGEVKTDVLIIGGGITGILCGYMLKNDGVDCVIAEADRICGGVTQNTTAKISCQHGAIYDRMIKRFGTETAAAYLKSQDEALRKYAKICKGIDCDFKKEDSFVYSLDDRQKLEREAHALNKLGYAAELVIDLPLPMKTAGAVKMKNQAQFHPLKFAFSVAKDLKIFEKTRVAEVMSGGAVTDNGRICAKKIIVATHFPFINKYGGYFLKLYQHRSYVIALKNAADVNGTYVDESGHGLSFRNYGDLLLLGGGGHRTGKRGGSWNELRGFAAEKYPESRELYHWATQDCKSLDDIPYIGRYSGRIPNLYVATGFNKWGMTSAMTAAMLLNDLVQDRTNDFARVYSPSRTVLRPQLAINGAEAMLGLITPTTPRCPHMGCALKYNKYERSWDCPCHGSRFANDGRLIDNPATGDKKLR